MNRGLREFLVIVSIGLLISMGSYVTLSDSAAVLFGFVYVMLIPLVHEGVNYRKHI